MLDRCAAQAISEQMELGLDEWTGGEYFTDDFIMHMTRVLAGIEIDKPAEDEIFDYDDFAHARIVGEISAPNGLGYASAYRRERQLPGGVRKATVVSPLEVTVHEADQREQIDAAMPGIITIVNAELRDLAAAGCPHIVLDAPRAGAEVNMGWMTADEAAEVIAPCFEGLDGVTRGIHFCNGNLRGRPISSTLRIAPWLDILKRLEGVIDVVSLECSYFSEWLERDAYRELPRSMELAAGIVDEASYGIESVKKIRDRAADWARIVGEERLWISPSCGFGRHSSRDNAVLRGKMENMMEAAASF